MHKKRVKFEAPAKKEGVNEGVEVGPHLRLHPNHVTASLNRLPFTEMVIGDVGLRPLHQHVQDEESKKEGVSTCQEKAKHGNQT